MRATENYNDLQGYKCNLEIRMKRQKDIHKVEYFDGVRVNPDTLPKGKDNER